MNNELLLTVKLSINAPVLKVWQALTDPELIQQYFFGTQTESNWQKGSPIYFRGEWDGRKYEDKGIILDIVPGLFLKYSYWSSMSGTQDLPENYAEISYTLVSDNNATSLTITQSRIMSEEAKRHSEENWMLVMNGMKKIVETESDR
jgi:uncharacterized protein YndB with AHSA1/START domain